MNDNIILEVKNLHKTYDKQEDEYTKTQENWDEEYYRMLLVWYRDNYADERLADIKSVGKEVYKDKLTLGKAKLQNRATPQKKIEPETSINEELPKKAQVVMATDNDEKKKRLSVGEWLKENWKCLALVAGIATGVVAVIATIIKLSSNK